MEIKKAGVVGTGMMGREISLVYAIAGYNVLMSDVSMEIAEKAKKLQAGVIDREVAKGRMTGENKDEILARISVTDKMEDFADCDIVTECVSEVFEIKKKVFEALDKICKPETILVTNTSSILITKVSGAVSDERKHRFIGMHYFSPAVVMKLVEVIPGLVCDDEITEFCIQLAKKLGKTPVKIKDNTGFAVNRMLCIFLAEAVRLLEEGVATVEDIDTACKLGLGHPVGPFEMLDNTQISLNYNVNVELMNEHGERFRSRPTILKKIYAGETGRNIGKGFYKYENNKKVGPMR